jgi:replicative DNA helicase
MTDRIPPQSQEAEQSVLGAMLNDSDCIVDVQAVLKADDFYRTAHRRIYEVILGMERVDVVLLGEALKSKGILEDCGGTYYLTELCEASVSSANVQAHAEVVLEMSRLRRLIVEAHGIQERAYNGEASEEIFADVNRLANVEVNSKETLLTTALNEVFTDLERGTNTKGRPSGVGKLDDFIWGFQDGELSIIAGRPSSGKTAFCTNIIRANAIHNNIPVLFFSLEMGKKQIAARLLSAEAKVDSVLIRERRVEDSVDWQRLAQRVGKIAEAPVHVDETGGINVHYIHKHARQAKRKHGIGLVLVDYIQLMSGFGENRQQEVSGISRGLKQIAKELQIPVIAVSQLSRACEERHDRRPQLSDLRESGAIEQDADVVIFLYRPEYYGIMKDAQGRSTEGVAELMVAKQRNGPVGTVYATFLKQFTSFEDIQNEGG